MEPIRVVARRGGAIESVHRVHGVAVRDGELVAEAGDRSLLASLRSAAKPFQALSLATVANLGDTELAIACASHQAEPAQLEAVRRLLDRIDATEDDLECGLQEGRPSSPIYHNCSGKHAGMLVVCDAESWPKEGYRLFEHPLQSWIVTSLAAAAGVSNESIPTAVDGCGVPCFWLPLERLAHAFAILEGAPGGDRVVRAMRSQPRLVGGEGALDSDLMETLPGWIAKRGAEGLLGAAGPDGLGMALKVEDGNGRALRPALGAFLAMLGLDGGPFGPVPTRNSRDEVVGELAVV